MLAFKGRQRDVLVRVRVVAGDVITCAANGRDVVRDARGREGVGAILGGAGVLWAHGMSVVEPVGKACCIPEAHEFHRVILAARYS